MGPNVGVPSRPASTPIVPSRRYSSASLLAARRTTFASPGRSAKLMDKSMGTTLSCPGPSGSPSGKSALAARLPSTNNVPASVPSRTPNEFGFVTFVQIRTPAPPSGPAGPGGSRRISAGCPSASSNLGAWTSARNPSSAAQLDVERQAAVSRSTNAHERKFELSVLVFSAGGAPPPLPPRARCPSALLRAVLKFSKRCGSTRIARSPRAQVLRPVLPSSLPAIIATFMTS